MEARLVHILIVFVATFNLAQLEPDQTGQKNSTWIWSEADSSSNDGVTETKRPESTGGITAATLEISAPILKVAGEEDEESKDKSESPEPPPGTIKTVSREGRSRGDGYSEVYNEEPVYREPTTNYQYSHAASDTQAYNLDNEYTANEPDAYASTNKEVSSYGTISDGTSSFHKPEYEESGRVVTGYQHSDEEKEGRFLSLGAIKDLFGLGGDKHKPPHRPHRPHGSYSGPHGPPTGPYGAYGPPPQGGPYKKPPFKRPPGFIPTAIHQDHRPHAHNKPPPHRPHHASRPHVHRPHHVSRPHAHRPHHVSRPHAHRPHPQDSYIPPKPVQTIPTQYLPNPKPYPPGISPSHQALDPYPKPSYQQPYQKPTAAPYIPSAALYPDSHKQLYSCKCVPEYLCKRADTVYHDGAGLIDERTKGALEGIESSKKDGDKGDLEAASSNRNDKYDAGEAIVLERRSLEVGGNESESLTGRSARYLDDDDVEVQVDVKIKANREARIVNHQKGKGRYIDTGHPNPGYPRPGHGNGLGGGQCKKPLVCCKNPLFDTGVPPVVTPSKHFPHHGGVRPQQKLGLCGRRVSLGIHGRIKNTDHYAEETDFGDYPWQVAILQQRSPSASAYACGGVLVSPRHVLTVAHCIIKFYHHGNYKSDLKVRLGEYDVSTSAEPYPYQEIYISKVHVHPYFDANLKNLHNDIAVVELKHPASVGRPHITPICLPNYATDFYGQRCFVSGWGKNAFGYDGKYQSRLKQVDVPIVSHHQCEERLRHTRLGPQYKLHHGFICAGGEYGKDACTGDGGSPLVCQDNYGAWQLVGLVSWGIGCANQNIPGVYVKVSHYHDWLAPLLRY